MPVNVTLSDISKAKGGPSYPVQIVATSPASARFYTSAGTSSKIVAVTLAVDVAGTHGSDVTIQVYRVKAGIAPASGQALLTAPLNLKATANSVQNGVMVTNADGYLNLNAGDSLAYVITGTATSVQANLTVRTAVANGNTLTLN
jgi:hypothetical protein